MGQSQSSYPSGHASAAMASLGFFAPFFYYALNGQDVVSSFLRVSLPFSCVMGPVMIAASRPRNYWHNFSDINMGMAIGLLCMVCCGIGWSNQMVIKPTEPAEKERLTNDSPRGTTAADTGEFQGGNNNKSNHHARETFSVDSNPISGITHREPLSVQGRGSGMAVQGRSHSTSTDA